MKNTAWPLFWLSWSRAVDGSFEVLLIAATAIVTYAPWALSEALDPTSWAMSRVQAACIFAWVAAPTLAIGKAATIGSVEREGGLGSFFSGMGVPCRTRFLWAALPSLIISAVFLVGAALVYESSFGWTVGRTLLSLQFIAAGVVVQLAIILLAMGAGAAFSASGGTVMTLLVWFYGLYGVQLLGLMQAGANSWALGSVWVFSPQLWLGDLTRRMVFDWGGMPWSQFAGIFSYLVLWGAIASLGGYALYRKGTGAFYR